MEYPSTITIDIKDSLYPKRLNSVKGASRLFAMGNLDLLRLDGIGFCGSRKASEAGLKTTEDCAEQAAKKGYVVISGNAAGIDSKAHLSCLKAGGNTILVLAEGISHFRVRRDFKEFWNWDKILVLSQFEPQAIWQVSRAMQRNQTIVAISKAMIVIEAGKTGGTINAGRTTLKFGVPLYVAEYKNMNLNASGNEILLHEGANRLAKSKYNGRANLEKLFNSTSSQPIQTASENLFNRG